MSDEHFVYRCYDVDDRLLYIPDVALTPNTDPDG